MAKLEFQQKLIQLKYNIPAGVPNTPTFDPFAHPHGFSTNPSATITLLSSPVYPSFQKKRFLEKKREHSLI